MTDLESKITSRKLELISEIKEHKKNSSRSGATEAIGRISAHLAELALIVKEGDADRNSKTKLVQWLAR
jgi:hypothetical protein